MNSPAKLPTLPPVLYGQVVINDRLKIGTFKLEYDKWSDRMAYRYYTEKGFKGQGVVSTYLARNLMGSGMFSTDPAKGRKDSYV